jgi:N-carbamoylputrescine amidase
MTSPKRPVSVAALQLSFSDDMNANIAAVSHAVRQAAAQGAQVILPPELFQGPYFCKTQIEDYYAGAYPLAEHPALHAMQALAHELGVVIPTSIYERDGPHFYNSLAMVGTQGEILGIYRKSHIPDGPGYQEKFYFRPGNTGFKVWDTPFGRLGVGICWDQWYPECARAMMLMGAELLFYPTAIGAEPHDPTLDTRRLWQRAMVGHAVSNVVPIIAANRIGDEPHPDGGSQRFYGCSFIADHRGDIVALGDDTNPNILLATFDLEAIARNRFAFGFFRDRRPELYQRLVQDI